MFLRTSPHHVLGLLPQLRLVDEFLCPGLAGSCVLKRMMYFSMPKILKYFRYISLTALNSCGELLRGAIDVRVVHVQRADAHEAEQFARLLVAVVSAVFGQAQRQVAVTARFRRENAVVMRAVHGFEVIALAPDRPLLVLASSIGGNIESL